MPTYLRYAAGAIGAIVILVLALAPLASVLVDSWSQRDLESRSRLVFLSIKDYVARQVAAGGSPALAALFEQLTEDEKLLAVGYCEDNGDLRFATKLMPSAFACASLARGEAGTFSTIESDGDRILVASFPIVGAKGAVGHLAVLHDLSFAENRAAQARLYWALAIAGAGLALVALATLSAFHLSRQWLGAIRQTIAEATGTAPYAPGSRRTDPLLGSELRHMVRKLQRAPPLAEGIQVEWSPQTLRVLLGQELPNAEVLVVSNREPYIHNRTAGGIEMQIPASGLVAALEPVMRACGGTWVAHGSGTADRETVDAQDRIAVPPDAPAYTLRRIWLSEDSRTGTITASQTKDSGRSAISHSFRPISRDGLAVLPRSQRTVRRCCGAGGKVGGAYHPCTGLSFCDPAALAETAPAARHDHHLLAHTVAERRDVQHLPLQGRDHQRPPREYDPRISHAVPLQQLPRNCGPLHRGPIDRELGSVTLGGHETIIRPYPISIEWPPQALAKQPPVADCRQAVRDELGLAEDVRIGVGVERFDYTKGRAQPHSRDRRVLSRHPEWLGRFVFIQAAAPSRSKLDSYRHLQEEAVSLAQTINLKYGRDGYEPSGLSSAITSLMKSSGCSGLPMSAWSAVFTTA